MVLRSQIRVEMKQLRNQICTQLGNRIFRTQLCYELIDLGILYIRLHNQVGRQIDWQLEEDLK